MEQAQYSLRQQLLEVVELANKSGLYDAADFIRNYLYLVDNAVKVDSERLASSPPEALGLTWR